MNEAQFLNQYLGSVLGLRFVPAATGPRLVVIDLPWPGEGLLQNEMFQKMMSAIGLLESEYVVIELLPSELESHLGRLSEDLGAGRQILSFSQELSDKIAESQSQLQITPQIMTVLGPRDLADHPELKKQTWLKLKKLSHI